MNFVAGIVVGVGASLASFLWTGFIYNKGKEDGIKKAGEPDYIMRDIMRTDSVLKNHLNNQEVFTKSKPKKSVDASSAYSYHKNLWFDRKKELEKLFYEENKGLQVSGTELRKLARKHGLLKGLKRSSEYSIVIKVMETLIKKGMARKVRTGRGKSSCLYTIYNLGNIVQ